MSEPTPAAGAAEVVSGDVAIDPRTGRPAGAREAAVLLAASCLSVLGAVLLAPVLPAVQRAFADVAGVEALAPLVLTAPALVIAITAPIAGRVVDRMGRKRLLVASLVAYAVVGMAPLVLPSLHLILVSRLLVGLTEAAIATCCTTMLADYFHGSRRERYFAIQVMCTTLAATLFFGLGGALGAQNWRTPFWLYVVSLPLAVAAARWVWQPVHADHVRRPLAPLPFARLAAPIGTTFLGGIVFYVLIVELSYRLEAIGVTATAVIGAVSAVSSLGTAAGAALFPRLVRSGPRTTVPVAFGISGIGLLGLGLVDQLPLLVVAAVVTGIGNGLLLPAMLSWAVASLDYAQRGRGTGWWTAAVFLGEFVCPIVVIGVSHALGGLGLAVAAVGVLAFALAFAVRAVRGGHVPAPARA